MYTLLRKPGCALIIEASVRIAAIIAHAPRARPTGQIMDSRNNLLPGVDECSGRITRIQTQSLAAGSKCGATLPLLSPHGRVSVQSEGFFPLIPSGGRTSVQSVGFIPLFSSGGRVSVQSVGFFPIFSPGGRVSAQSVGFFPLFSSGGRVSARDGRAPSSYEDSSLPHLHL